MQIFIQDINQEVVTTFEGSIEETAQKFVDHIKGGHYEFEKIFPRFGNDTSPLEATSVFDLITRDVINEDLLEYKRFGNIKGIHIDSGLDNELSASAKGKRFSLTIEKTEDGDYQVSREFSPIKDYMIYKIGSAKIDDNGNISGGRPKVLSSDDKKIAKAAHQVFVVKGLKY